MAIFSSCLLTHAGANLVEWPLTIYLLLVNNLGLTLKCSEGRKSLISWAFVMPFQTRFIQFQLTRGGRGDEKKRRGLSCFLALFMSKTFLGGEVLYFTLLAPAATSSSLCRDRTKGRSTFNTDTVQYTSNSSKTLRNSIISLLQLRREDRERHTTWVSE